MRLATVLEGGRRGRLRNRFEQENQVSTKSRQRILIAIAGIATAMPLPADPGRATLIRDTVWVEHHAMSLGIPSGRSPVTVCSVRAPAGRNGRMRYPAWRLVGTQTELPSGPADRTSFFPVPSVPLF
jgi:hypothetical protein